MSRAQRLLALIQLLRSHQYPVTSARIAAELGVSQRSVYRDIATLQAQGADIAGEAGLGYVLRPGFMLPPLMFSEEEIEALVLGARWVAEHGDVRLAEAAQQAVAKIGAVLPAPLRQALELSALLPGPAAPQPSAAGDTELPAIRQAIRAERKIEIRYLDLGGAESARTVWPFAVGFFDRVRVLVAWCELRQDYRHFRTDRILAFTVLDQRYARRRAALLKEWRAREVGRTATRA